MQQSLAITSESRTETKSQQIYLLQNLVISPLKYESISRLVGCVLAVRLTTAVQENIPCKRREHILLDRQSGLFMLNQLHCQIIKTYVAHSVREIHCSLRTPPMLVLDQFPPRTKKSANSGENDLHFSRNQSHNGQRRIWSRNLEQPN